MPGRPAGPKRTRPRATETAGEHRRVVTAILMAVIGSGCGLGCGCGLDSESGNLIGDSEILLQVLPARVAEKEGGSIKPEYSSLSRSSLSHPEPSESMRLFDCVCCRQTENHP